MRASRASLMRRLQLIPVLSGPFKDRMTRLRFLGVLVASLASSACGLFCIACDGALGADGQVYEWADAPAGAESTVHVDSVDWVKPEGLVPVQGAELVLEPWTPERRPKNPDAARLWTRHTHSDAAGAFTMSGAAKPGWYKVTLAVRRDGYRPIEHVFMHDRFRHKVIVLLVRDSATAEQNSGPDNNKMQTSHG
jgi:hypothetical protein